MILIIALALVLMGIVIYATWYVNASPKLELGQYKNLKVVVDTDSRTNVGNLMEATDEDEIIKQALLNKIIKQAKFSHLAKKIDERYEEFITYYGQIATMYDYDSVEDMAIKYYGYDSLEAFENAVMDYSELSVKQEMILSEIAKKEGFSVTDEIFNKYIGNYLKAYDYKEDEVEAYLNDYGKDEVYGVILNDYTLDYLVSVNNIVK